MANENKLIDIDMGYARLSKTLADLKPIYTKIGYPEGEVDRSVVEKAVWNHFGVPPRVPPRPFMTIAFDRDVDEYAALLLSSVDEYLETGDVSALVRGFDVTGAIAAQGIRETIIKFTDPPNAPLTIALKGRDDPLVDTGEMRDEVTHVTVEAKTAFKPADTAVPAAKAFISARRGKSRGRGRGGISIRNVRSLTSLAKSPGYSGRGIRKSPGRRKAAKGVASRGVRRK